MQDIKVQTVFNQGEKQCTHKWVYNKPSMLTFTYPAVIIQQRICDCCGRLEEVRIEGTQAKSDVKAFIASKARFL